MEARSGGRRVRGRMRVRSRGGPRRGWRRGERVFGEHALAVGEDGGDRLDDALREENDGAAILRGGRGLVGVGAGFVLVMKPGVQTGAVRARREQQDHGYAQRRQQELKARGEVARAGVEHGEAEATSRAKFMRGAGGGG